MKIFISSDMEGTAGVTHWDETNKGTELYPHFTRQMSREVAAACEGALSAGATEVLVKDAHDTARNIDPELLPEQARIFRAWGSHPYSMMAGLDSTYSGVMFTGYHSCAGSDENPLAHTMNTKNHYVKLNGELCPELYINCLTAAYEGVPVYMVAGDAGICEWIRRKNPNITTVAVSEGVGGGSISVHPNRSVEMIYEAAKRAAGEFGVDRMFPMPDSFKVEICFRNHQHARSGGYYPGCTQTGARTVEYESRDYMDVLKFLFWVL